MRVGETKMRGLYGRKGEWENGGDKGKEKKGESNIVKRR